MQCLLPYESHMCPYLTYDDPLCHSWDHRYNLVTSHASIDSSYTLGYVDYLFGRGSRGFKPIDKGNLLDLCMMVSCGVMKLSSYTTVTF